MTATIVQALLPVVVTLLLGFAAGWHHEFDGGQAIIFEPHGDALCTTAAARANK